MQFALYELAINPEIQERLAAELEQASGTEEGLNYDAINSLPYLNMVTAGKKVL
jgi:cytochrome P450